ncbi:MAG: hypothetical protein Q9198_002097 [Flavoplaca austrocitrina]
MDDIPPSYEAATQHDYWSIIAGYVQSSDDLCAASRVCRRWHEIYTPLLWGNPAFHFETEDDKVYGSVSSLLLLLLLLKLTNSSGLDKIQAKLDMAQAELYDSPRREWLRDALERLPNLQSLLVSQLPFFDHASLLALRNSCNPSPADDEKRPSFPLRLLIATQCTNTTPRSLADAFLAFPHLVFLDLSRTLGARDAAVLSKLGHMTSLQILKLSGIQLRDEDVRVLSDAIGIRVRSLDVRNNLLTDNAIRTLLRSCFLVVDKPQDAGDRRSGELSGAEEEDWPSDILKPDPAVLDEFRDESFDLRYLRRLTRGVVSRLPSEDQAHAGITHLYISNNYLTIDGLSSLIRSGRLHVLDAGTVDTARVIDRPSSSASAQATNLHSRTFGLPGAEKLTSVLAKCASKNLTSLRVDHSVVTKSTIIKAEKAEPDIHELSSDGGLQELPMPSPGYESALRSSERSETSGDPVKIVLSPPAPAPTSAYQDPKTYSQITRNGKFSFQVMDQQDKIIEEEDEGNPIMTATGLEPAAQAINGIQSPISPVSPLENSLDMAMYHAASCQPSSPQLSFSTINKQRKDLQQRQSSQLHGLLPSMLPRLRSLILTDVPCYDYSGQVTDALIQFITYCASEAELAKLQVDLESKYSIAPHENGPRPTRQNVEAIFALRRITLEMSPPNSSSPANALPAGSPKTSRTTNNTLRTKSSTEDPDSEAFWAAQENDFSFFDHEEECGLPSTEPGSRTPILTISEKMNVPQDCNAASPSMQRQSQATTNTGPGGKDVIQQLVKFRKDRKAAFEEAVKRGERTVEGYWPGEVKVVRWQGGKTGMVDYYGNQFEKGYFYR